MPTVVALEFQRSPKCFLDCIVGGEDLDKHMVAMLAVGRPCIFGPDGAKLLVCPDDVNDVLFHLSTSGLMFDDLHVSWDDLHPRHIIVSETLEAELMAVLAATPGSGVDGGKGNDKVKVKRRVVLNIPKAVWHSQADKGFDTANVMCSLSF
jgi:hypothetical protein